MLDTKSINALPISNVEAWIDVENRLDAGECVSDYSGNVASPAEAAGIVLMFRDYILTAKDRAGLLH